MLFRLAFVDGGQGRNRTTDTRIFSPLLYLLSYLALLSRLQPLLQIVAHLALNCRPLGRAPTAPASPKAGRVLDRPTVGQSRELGAHAVGQVILTVRSLNPIRSKG